MRDRPRIERDEEVWAALEPLRDSAVVNETRRRIAELGPRQPARCGRARRFMLPTGLAAAAALGAVLLSQPAVKSRPPSELATSVGELRRVALADGSSVLLDTDTRIRISFGTHGRNIDLIAGKARFDVAHDAERPFRVRAGAMTVTALGTSFDVAALPARTSVTLLQGRVSVRTSPDGRSTAPVLLVAGEQVSVDAGRLGPKRRPRLEGETAWQRAMVDLDNMTLGQALDEVNRYSTVKLVVENPMLRREQVSGVFRAGDVEAVAAALNSYFDLRVEQRTEREIVLAPAH